MLRYGTLALALLTAGVAHPADTEFRDITWVRHDRETGFREWELTARTARPINRREYTCTRLELRTYRLVERDGRKRAEPEWWLRALRGTYRHGPRDSRADLQGDIRATLYGRAPLVIRTDRAVLESRWDRRTRTTSRTIITRSHVVATSDTRTLTGDGMTVVESVPSGRPDKKRKSRSFLTVERNVVMTMKETGGGTPFPTIPGSRPAPPSAKNAPVTISCLGPLIYDRQEGLAVFRNDVKLTRAGTALTSDGLALRTEETAVGGRQEVKLQYLYAYGNVKIITTGQEFTGEGFEWYPKLASGKLEGKADRAGKIVVPATMTSPDMSGRADRIRFDEKAGRILYIGNARLHITLTPE